MTRFAFLADCQLGCRATFSGLDQNAIDSLSHRDIHVEPFPAEDGHEWDTDQLEKAIELVNGIELDFVVFGGDMIDDARNHEQLASFRGATDRLRAPVRFVPGNHDAAFDGEQPTNRSLTHYEERFGSDLYSFHTDDASFIVLNTTLMHRPERVPHRCEEQFAFIRRELEAAATRGGPTILFGHHPLFLVARDEDDSYWNVPRQARDPLLESIRTFGIAAMFAGHYHRNQVAFDGPFEMVTSGPVGFPLGDDPSGVRIVEIVGDRISHTYHPLD